MNWKRIPTGDVPFDITRPSSGSYEATRGELVLSDGYDVELPPPEPDAVVAVATVGDSGPITVTASGSTRVCRVPHVTLESLEPVVFVAANAQWYVSYNDSGVRPTDFVAYTEDGHLTIRGAENQQPYLQITERQMGYGNDVAATDEYYLATYRTDGEVRIVDHEAREIVDVVSHTDAHKIVAGDSRFFVTSAFDNDITVYSLDDRAELKTWTDPGDTINDLDIDARHQIIVAGSDDGRAYLFDPGSDSAIYTISHFDSYVSVAVSADYILTTSGKDIRVQDRFDLGNLYWEYTQHNQTGSYIRDIVAREFTDTNGSTHDLAFFGGDELSTTQISLDNKSTVGTYSGQPADNLSAGRDYFGVYGIDSQGSYRVQTYTVNRDDLLTTFSKASDEAYTGGSPIKIYPD